MKNLNRNSPLLLKVTILITELEEWLHATTTSEIINSRAVHDSRQIAIDLLFEEVIAQRMLTGNIEWNNVYIALHQIRKLIYLLQDTRYSEHTHILKCMYICSEIVVIQNRRIQKLLN